MMSKRELADELAATRLNLRTVERAVKFLEEENDELVTRNDELVTQMVRAYEGVSVARAMVRDLLNEGA